MDSNLLKAKMLCRGIKSDVICDCLGISRSAWFRKLSGKNDFTRREVALISSALSLDEVEMYEIFFAKEVANAQR